MSELNEIQLAARQVPGHWYQGDTADGNGNFCGIGHLLEVIGLSTCNSAAVDGKTELARQMILCMNEAAWDKFPERAGDEEFVGFNDHPHTIEAEVVAVMELAGERWAIEHA